MAGTETSTEKWGEISNWKRKLYKKEIWYQHQIWYQMRISKNEWEHDTNNIRCVGGVFLEKSHGSIHHNSLAPNRPPITHPGVHGRSYGATKSWDFQKQKIIPRCTKWDENGILVGGFNYFFIFIPTCGRFPIWLIFFKGVETSN